MHEEMMRRAVLLAARGRGHTAPNPLVGAVLVRDGEILGEGWHAVYGGLHAERAALEDCKRRGHSPKDAVLYVTLEPCCHHGKQPPCTEAVIDAGIRAVFVGSADPNPLVAGKGVAALRAAGIQVTEGFLADECDALNAPFFRHMKTGLPLVTVKYAMTLDGKTACASGASRGITGEAAREEVHRSRAASGAVMVGINTVLKDDPLLTCRIPGGRNPLRVVCDSALRTPLSSALVNSAAEIPTLLACCVSDSERHAPYLRAGCEVLCFSGERVPLPELLRCLGERGINEVFVEGGAELAWSLISEGLAQRVQAYIAPKLFGGRTAPSALGGDGVALPDEAFRLKKLRLRQLDADILLEGEL